MTSTMAAVAASPPSRFVTRHVLKIPTSYQVDSSSWGSIRSTSTDVVKSKGKGDGPPVLLLISTADDEDDEDGDAVLDKTSKQVLQLQAIRGATNHDGGLRETVFVGKLTRNDIQKHLTAKQKQQTHDPSSSSTPTTRALVDEVVQLLVSNDPVEKEQKEMIALWNSSEMEIRINKRVGVFDVEQWRTTVLTLDSSTSVLDLFMLREEAHQESQRKLQRLQERCDAWKQTAEELDRDVWRKQKNELIENFKLLYQTKHAREQQLLTKITDLELQVQQLTLQPTAAAAPKNVTPKNGADSAVADDANVPNDGEQEFDWEEAQALAAGQRTKMTSTKTGAATTNKASKAAATKKKTVTTTARTKRSRHAASAVATTTAAAKKKPKPTLKAEKSTISKKSCDGNDNDDDVSMEDQEGQDLMIDSKKVEASVGLKSTKTKANKKASMHLLDSETDSDVDMLSSKKEPNQTKSAHHHGNPGAHLGSPPTSQTAAAPSTTTSGSVLEKKGNNDKKEENSPPSNAKTLTQPLQQNAQTYEWSSDTDDDDCNQMRPAARSTTTNTRPNKEYHFSGSSDED